MKFGRWTVVAAFVALCELASLLALSAIGYYPSIARGYLPTYEAHPNGTMMPWFAPLRPHPYFGYQYDKSENQQVNNHGFLSPIDYPYHKEPNDFVIGITGGSVPEQLALEMIRSNTLSQLALRVPELKGKRIVLLNLCLPAAKQPQQYMVAAYFMSMLDLVVNIYGTWETFVFDKRYPVDFPEAYHQLYGSGTLGAVDWGFLIGFRWVDDFMTHLPLSVRPLAWSSSYFLAWKIVTRAKRGARDWVLNRNRLRPESEPAFFRKPRNETENAEEQLESWARFTFLESAVARAEGRKAVFLVRPSQYFPSGQSDGPLDEFFYPGLKPSIQERYASLLERARGLKKKGVLIYDLTDSFEKPKDVYRDSLDHLNRAGRKILTDRIVDVLVQHSKAIFGRTN